MKYKAGDKVRIKSIDWYNENKDSSGDVHGCKIIFNSEMSMYCGKEMTIEETREGGQFYYLYEDIEGYIWTDDMIEGLVEEPTILNGKEVLLKLVNIELPSGTTNIWECPKGYQFKDEDGNIINATKIVLEKKNKYPKTYEECCKVIGINRHDVEIDLPQPYQQKMFNFFKLIICRNTYWKIAGEEMGLGKAWEPDFLNPTKETRYFLFYTGISIENGQALFPANKILIFPTEKMRDTFYENFKELIEQCKELL